FVENAGTYEGASNRTFVLAATSMLLPIYYYNNDSSHAAPPGPIVKNTVTFQVDMSSFLGTGVGKFDISKDSLVIGGIIGWGEKVAPTNLTGNRTLTPGLFNKNIFTTTLTFYASEGETLFYKYVGYPASEFTNGGYELSANRTYVVSSDTVNDTTLAVVVPNIALLYPAITHSMNITLHVDMNNAVDARNKVQIDPTKINFVGVSGSLSHALGPWSLNWSASDTVDGPTWADTISTIKVLHDDGKNGDQVAGDHIWSIEVTVPAGTPGGLYEYKYCCDYPGFDTATINLGSGPLDDEMPTDINHQYTLIDGPDMVINNIFGVQDSVGSLPTGIKQADNNLPKTFTLDQNYPNPFNPSTIIKYSVPKGQLVTLKVYNMLGQEVATLVNNQQNAGNYEVTFNADRLASGIYFYTLNAGSFVSTKKMILLK
ncbi:MAG TPA: T9SS type A sorting domain-containing protein, partial [Ignavibacteriaceae bacterium]|nr:T9SS type A sorting domain-containing protein [Ignavibacteriaceae bacterium]